VNRPTDVMLVQHLLNLNNDNAELDVPLVIRGDVDELTHEAIRSFQRNQFGTINPDGRVDAGGRTFVALSTSVRAQSKLEILRAVTRCSSASGGRPGEASSDVSIIDPNLFVPRHSQEFGRLGAAALDGITTLVDFINNDFEIQDVGWAAYMFATVERECANTWQPIREFGRGSGHPYGNPVNVRDAAGVIHSNTYYGRGYVQLTWKDNYQKLSLELGLGDELLINPDDALDPDIAYQILSFGMRNGSFSAGQTLSRHININRCDYKNARRIVNGTDHADEMAASAGRFELLIRVSCTGSVSDSGF
jgi:hypothetical protein